MKPQCALALPLSMILAIFSHARLQAGFGFPITALIWCTQKGVFRMHSNISKQKTVKTKPRQAWQAQQPKRKQDNKRNDKRAFMGSI
jgi:hypothetical protein